MARNSSSDPESSTEARAGTVRSWKSRAALAAGVGAPSGLVLAGDPAAANEVESASVVDNASGSFGGHGFDAAGFGFVDEPEGGSDGLPPSFEVAADAGLGFDLGGVPGPDNYVERVDGSAVANYVEFDAPAATPDYATVSLDDNTNFGNDNVDRLDPFAASTNFEPSISIEVADASAGPFAVVAEPADTAAEDPEPGLLGTDQPTPDTTEPNFVMMNSQNPDLTNWSPLGPDHIGDPYDLKLGQVETSVVTPVLDGRREMDAYTQEAEQIDSLLGFYFDGKVSGEPTLETISWAQALVEELVEDDFGVLADVHFGPDSVVATLKMDGGDPYHEIEIGINERGQLETTGTSLERKKDIRRSTTLSNLSDLSLIQKTRHYRDSDVVTTPTEGGEVLNMETGHDGKFREAYTFAEVDGVTSRTYQTDQGLPILTTREWKKDPELERSPKIIQMYDAYGQLAKKLEREHRKAREYDVSTGDLVASWGEVYDDRGTGWQKRGPNGDVVTTDYEKGWGVDPITGKSAGVSELYGGGGEHLSTSWIARYQGSTLITTKDETTGEITRERVTGNKVELLDNGDKVIETSWQ